MVVWVASGPAVGSARRCRERSDRGEHVGEHVGPWPSGREPQREPPGLVGEHGGERGDPGAQRPVVDRRLPGEERGPAVEVVSQDGGGEPGAVGVEVPGRDVFESAVFQVADGELDDGMSAVELICGDGVEGGVVMNA